MHTNQNILRTALALVALALSIMMNSGCSGEVQWPFGEVCWQGNIVLFHKNMILGDGQQCMDEGANADGHDYDNKDGPAGVDFNDINADPDVYVGIPASIERSGDVLTQCVDDNEFDPNDELIPWWSDGCWTTHNDLWEWRCSQWESGELPGDYEVQSEDCDLEAKR